VVRNRDVVAQRVVSPALVGRGDELAALTAAIPTPPTVVVLDGEAGIGKTRLLAELRDQIRDSERWFVAGWCRRIREPFPLGPVIDAIRGLGGELANSPLSPVAGALRPLLPEVAEVLPPAPAPLDDRVAERHRVFRALVEVFGSLGPVVLALEDLHWADEQTADFVSYLLSDMPPKLSLVLTYRSEEVDPTVRVLTAKLPPSVTLANLQLRPLDEPATGVLAAAILGTPRVSREFAHYLHERTSGVPFAIEELLALLRTRGALDSRRGQRSRESLAELNVPDSIRDSVRERVCRLSADGRTVAEAAAVLQTPVPVAVLASTCTAPAARTMEVLDEVLGSGLLAEDGDRIGFRHLLAAHAVYEAIPSARRQQLHGRAAAALASAQPTPAGQLAHHLRHAGHHTAWVAAAERAAERAAELGHHNEAVRLLEDVLRHAPLSTEHRGRVAVTLARTAIDTLHAEDLRSILLEVPAANLPREQRSELRFWLALLLNQAGGDPHLQRRLFLEAVEELDDRPDLEAWAMVGLGVPAGDPQVPLSEHLHWLRRSLEIVPRLDHPALATLVLGKVAMVLIAVGDPQWQEMTDRMRIRTGGTPSHRREVSAYESVGGDACYVGHHETAHELLTAAAAGAEACQNRRLELRSQARLALLDYCRGNWHALRERTEVLSDELAHYTEARIDTEVVLGGLALAHGDLDTAHRRLSDVARSLQRVGGLDLLPLPVAALARLNVARGDPEPAQSIARQALDAIAAKGIWPPVARMLPSVAQAMVAAGQGDEAGDLVADVAARAAGLDAPLFPAAVRHARGFVSEGRQRWREAVAHFTAAAAAYELLCCPYEAAQARECAARCLLTVDDPGGAPLLREALEAYQRLGASWDAARAAGTARRHGVGLPAAHRGGRRGYGDELSPRQQEVACLAAAGMTNEEIAQRLYLSPKTVDKHVCAALRKLGLHSRRELARHVPTGDAVRQGGGVS
jgi:DNA-binding CsgD family transcriptional regulator